MLNEFHTALQLAVLNMNDVIKCVSTRLERLTLAVFLNSMHSVTPNHSSL